jgi:glucuronoarabinoxylan endo-1,4-beta-xylanase
MSVDSRCFKKSLTVARFLVWAILLIVPICSSSYGQSHYVVKGTVTTSGVPVRNALVTLTDNTNSSNSYNTVTDSTGTFNMGTITGIEQSHQLPTGFHLDQNYPNPFSSKTAISYDLDKQSDVKVTIYDILGRAVRNFSMGYQQAGVHGIIWNGRDELGRIVAPGVYLYRLQALGRAEARKMLFGTGATGSSVSLAGTPEFAANESSKGKEVIYRLPTFNIFVANTDSTNPLVQPRGFGNISIHGDTTMSLSVGELGPAVVNVGSTEQLIRGFGGANTVNWQDHNMTSSEIQEAFGTDSGDIGFSIMRLRIPPDSGSFKASVAPAKQAESLGAIIIATPWTPPTWMKTNGKIAGGYLETSNYAVYAAHLKAFADTMANNGAPLYAISVQNEPDAAVNYESCFWTATQFLNFMRYDAPNVGVPVFMPESEGFNHAYSDSTLSDSLADAHTAFIAGHLYGTTPSDYPLARSKGKELWMTEYLDTATTWNSALGTAMQINDCMTVNMSAYVWWWTVDNWSMINANGKVTKRGYAMSQYARFVRPGYHRLFASSNPQSGVYMTAYEGNGKTVIVMVNTDTSSTAQPITLESSSVTSFTPYVTSSTKDCAQGSSVPVSSGAFLAKLDASSVTTFVSN